MSRIKKLNPIVRAVSVMSAVAISVTGVTYAALQSTATLSQNTISAADSNLRIWDGDSFEVTAPGFNVTNLIPGSGSSENWFYLKNESAGPLYVYAHVPETPGVPGDPGDGYGFTGWENLKVTFRSYEPGCGADTVNTTMAALMAGNVAMPCNSFATNAQGNSGAEETEGNFTVKFDIEPSSVTPGGDPGVGAFDIDFIGDLVAPPVVPTP